MNTAWTFAAALATPLCLLGNGHFSHAQAQTTVSCSNDRAFRPANETPAGSDANWCERTKDYWTHTLGQVDATKKASCNGNRQSPIALQGELNALRPVVFDYAQWGPIAATVKNTGHTISLPLAGLGGGRAGVTVSGETYPLKELHFHYPSEHVWAGERFALELHLVHEFGSGQQLRRAVVAVLIKSGGGENNNALDTLFGKITTATKDSTNNVSFTGNDLANVLPENKNNAMYAGSLTTPFASGGCEENVTWIVLATPVQASQAQIAKFKAAISYTEHFKVNARPYDSRSGADRIFTADFRGQRITTQNVTATPGADTSRGDSGLVLKDWGGADAHVSVSFRLNSPRDITLSLYHASQSDRGYFRGAPGKDGWQVEKIPPKFGLAPVIITINGTPIVARYDVSEAHRSFDYKLDRFTIPRDKLRAGENTLRIEKIRRFYGKEPPHTDYLLRWLALD